MTLRAVKVFEVPRGVVETSDAALKAAGKDGYELFVLWTGRTKGDRFHVEHAYIPRQRSFQGESGLHVRVEAEDLNALNRWLYQNKQQLGVQVHTHPDTAYHSKTDNAFPIVTTLGGLSIVVPNFAEQGIGCPGTAIYRLAEDGWSEINIEIGRDLLQLVP